MLRWYPQILRIAMFTIFALCVLLMSGCVEKFHCPTTSDTITWTSYGQFQFGNSGDDSTARNCVSICDWHVYGANNGGTGATLQVASPASEVVFVWAYNNFAQFRVFNGWTGQTDQGVKLGDSKSTFLSHYPGFAAVTTEHLTFTDSNSTVDAWFDGNNLLTEIDVGVANVHYLSEP